MLALMERKRMIFDTEERYRRAVKLYAARYGKTTSEVFHDAIAALCKDELQEADEILKKAAKRKPEKPAD